MQVFCGRILLLRKRRRLSLKLTAEDAKTLGIIERIIPENDLGKKDFYDSLRLLLSDEISNLAGDPDLIEKRYDRFRRIGVDAVAESLKSAEDFSPEK